jgi:hypothetical protein
MTLIHTHELSMHLKDYITHFGTFGSPKIANVVYFGLMGTCLETWEHAREHVQLVIHEYEYKELWLYLHPCWPP